MHYFLSLVPFFRALSSPPPIFFLSFLHRARFPGVYRRILGARVSPSLSSNQSTLRRALLSLPDEKRQPLNNTSPPSGCTLTAGTGIRVPAVEVCNRLFTAAAALSPLPLPRRPRRPRKLVIVREGEKESAGDTREYYRGD